MVCRNFCKSLSFLISQSSCATYTVPAARRRHVAEGRWAEPTPAGRPSRTAPAGQFARRANSTSASNLARQGPPDRARQAQPDHVVLCRTQKKTGLKATTGEIYSACSVRVRSSQQAEEAAIALALTDQGCSTVLSDSRSAIRSYARNRVCKSAVKICEVQCSDSNAADTVPATYLRWFPAHTPATSGPHPN